MNSNIYKYFEPEFDINNAIYVCLKDVNVSFIIKVNTHDKKEYVEIDENYFTYTHEIEELFKKYKIPIVSTNAYITDKKYCYAIICKKYIHNIRDWNPNQTRYGVQINLIDDDGTMIYKNMLIDGKYEEFIEKYNKIESTI
jgi:hypothetical protein